MSVRDHFETGASASTGIGVAGEDTIEVLEIPCEYLESQTCIADCPPPEGGSCDLTPVLENLEIIRTEQSQYAKAAQDSISKIDTNGSSG